MKSKTLQSINTLLGVFIFFSLFSCNHTIQTGMEKGNIEDSFYSPKVLRSNILNELPSYTSKADILKKAQCIAMEKFKSRDIQITDVFLYPSIDGVEFFYRLENGVETNALLVKAKSLKNIEFQADQIVLHSDRKHPTKIKLESKEAVVMRNGYTISESDDIVFSCNNKNNCKPCKVIMSFEDDGNHHKKVVRCGSCDGCGLKADIMTDYMD